jgi:predicted Fe-Mo cluster-binding NifX family protein
MCFISNSDFKDKSILHNYKNKLKTNEGNKGKMYQQTLFENQVDGLITRDQLSQTT